MSNTSPDITDVSPERRELPGPPAEAEGGDFDACPLSFAQERLWFLDQLEPGNALYNVPLALSLEGPLDPEVLACVLTEVARRHESLRTTFHTHEGRPVQVVGPAREVVMARLDLSHLPPDDRAAESRRATEAEARKPFDLSRGPAWRALLTRLGDDEHVLLLTLHHIVVDGWSMGVLAREAAALYAAFSRGLPSPLEELPIQYADYAIWQRESLQGAALEEQLDYWRARLAGVPPVLQLPTDRPRPARPSLRGESLRFGLSEKLTREVNDLGRRAGATPFMILLAAWQAVLSRHTNQTDIAVGVPVAGRQQREMEGLIGFFINTLVLRTDLSGDPTFDELLGRVRETALGAYAHQDVPFERLVEELQPTRSLTHTPLFQVAFNFRNDQLADAPSPSSPSRQGMSLRRLPVDRGTAKFDLSLNVADGKDGYRAVIEYSTELFDEATVVRLSGHFKTLLEAAVANPARRVAELPLLSEAEREQLLVAWNDTRRDYAPAACVHELFAAQAERTPDAAALVHENESLTYAELNGRANALAHHLRGLGVGPESRVGVLMDRSAALVVALLGILKSGAAYVPLDPDYPRERLAYMIEDAGLAVLLTQSRLQEDLPGGGAKIISLDLERDALAARPTHEPDAGATPDNLAYVIYTSGSTGKPKGVGIEHRSAHTFLRWAHETFTRDELSGVLASTSVCFDLSVFELFAPLTCGGAVVLAENALALPTHPAAHQVTLVNTVPSAMAELARMKSLPPSVKTVNLAGEPLKLALVEAVYEQETVGRVLNLYGPSEDTTYSTFVALERGEGRAPTIGRPVANTRVYLLDKFLQLVPVGAAGELYIGGEGLARGYLGRPEMTAEKFVPDPFSAEPGRRLYRTGDLARYLPDGELEFLGRIDHQVKVRGYRIELGEVEAVLCARADVREAVVMARDDGAGQSRLVAYVVGEAGAQGGVSELRAGLRERLPEYMIPSAFVFLDELPLTPNGKVDRKALPAPGQTRAGSAADFIAPRTPAEEVLAALWGQVLRIERVGVEDNFFELGGHSLLATQLIARVREAFRVELPLRTLFESPTVGGLAAEVEAALRSGRDASPPPLARADRDQPLPLSFAQERLWFLEQFAPGGSVYHIPAAVRLEGRLDACALERALREVARRHESLRTSFRKGPGGTPVQVVSEATDFELPLTDLSALTAHEREAEARRLAGEEARRPFDLAAGPLWRARLLRLGDEEHALLLNTHHIISDGWSQGVLVRELGALYAAFAAGEPSPLAELPVQYADYAVWQRELLRGEELERQLDYWRAQLAGAPPVLELPTDRPRPPAQGFRGKTRSFTLPRELSESLKALSRVEGVTLYMTLLAAFQTLLSRYTDQEDVVVGTPIAGRGRLETESLIGFFVNTLVLRTDLSGDPSFRELLRRVREVTLGAYAHQDVPFERLVEELQPERSLSRSPLFQVLFALQNAPSSTLELPGLRLSAPPSDVQTAKFDLTLAMQENGDRLVGSLNYDADLFDDATAARLISHFENLLRAAVAAPDQIVSSLPLLSEAEREQLLAGWNDTRGDYPREASLRELFEEQAAARPDAVAVAYAGGRLTYGELNARANALAHRLRAEGVGPEVVVGVCAERSAELIVALLGVLKAGGAYLPLDPSSPRERLSFMLADAGARLLLTQQRLLDALPADAPPVIILDAERPAAAESERTDNPGVKVFAENLAYVTYTSGSTGRPKGVAVTQRGVARLVKGADYAAFGPEEVFLQFAPVAFDASTFEVWGSLLNGARLVVMPAEAQTLAELGRALREHGVTTLWLTAGLFHVMTDERAEDLRGVRQLLAGGDVLSPAHVRKFLRAADPGSTLINGYGPTENTTFTCCHPVRAGVEFGQTVPIGRPVAQTQAYVLDAHLRPAPVGVAGELYAGGDGLARAYVNRPELTAERFVPHPFSAEPGQRLYRTGDVARYLPDGTLEFLGRRDAQVKVRGFRIELGEVESALARHEGVGECVVAARAGEAGDKYLAAYVVAAAGTPAPDGGELRAHLKGLLPDYMIPAAFVFLEELPLTPNGKVDRDALPEPGRDRPESARGFVAPRNEVEAGVAEMWAELLGVERVGVEDNFFELGGHSLLATRLSSRVSEAFGVELPLRRLFESPTVAAVAVAILQKQSERLDEDELERLLAELEQSPD